jgi:CO/xanthine dehydrogenase Mo-binding subunit
MGSTTPPGQLLAGSFMDYALPRADDLPSLEAGFHPGPGDQMSGSMIFAHGM